MSDKALAEIQEKVRSVDASIESFLRSCGWELSCDFADYRWRWCKKTGDRIICLSRNEALGYEEFISRGDS